MPEDAAPDHADEWRVAEEVLLDFLEKRAAGDPVTLEDLCDTHPGLATPLKRLFDDYTHAVPILDSVRPQPSPSDSPLFDTQGIVLPAEDGSDAELLEKLPDYQDSGGRYRFRGQIAQGGMAAIYRIWDENLKRPLAMKVRRDNVREKGGSTSHQSPSSLLRFLEEAQITGQLDHPGIVPVHDLGLDSEGNVFFTMRLVKGTTLMEIIDKKRDDPKWNQTRVLNIILRACEAIAYAHSKGVIHRDLKPSNIMVGKFGETYVMDWGLAKVLGRPEPEARTRELLQSTHSKMRTHRSEAEDASTGSPIHTLDGEIVGTPAYMPPEQAQGLIERIGPQADVYAMGAVLYHLLAGHMPYVTKGERASVHMVLSWVRERPPTPLTQMDVQAPTELIAICEKAMVRDPSRRYRDMVEMAEDLRAYLDQRVVNAYQTGAIAEFKKWVLRNKGMATSTLTAILMSLLALAGIAFVQNQGKKNEASLRAVAQQNELEAREAKLLSECLADAWTAIDLERQAMELWPCRPHLAERMEAWLKGAHDLTGRLDNHREVLSRFRERGTLRRDQTWHFETEEDEGTHARIDALITRLETMEAPRGLIQEIEARLERASSIESLTVDEHYEVWERVFADLEEDVRFEGVLFDEPLIGFIPLEKDPRSGLWEFLVWESGERPVRDPETGELQITEETGIVMVLLPPAKTFHCGSTAKRGSINHDPGAMRNEGPVRAIRVHPFLIAKYEITQAQWVRMTGENPSVFSEELNVPLAHPVENVNWIDAMNALALFDLTLPTSDQWEYAARANTTSPWISGGHRSGMQRYANLLDRSYRTRFESRDRACESWDDTHAVHAPVGSLMPNDFGLYDVFGNVWEWCRDYNPGDAGTGMNSSRPSMEVCLRGGAYSQRAEQARSALKNPLPPEMRGSDAGLRPARELHNQ